MDFVWSKISDLMSSSEESIDVNSFFGVIKQGWPFDKVN